MTTHKILSSTILDTIPHLGLALDPRNYAHRATILSLPARIEGGVFPPEVGNAVRELWCDPAVKEAVKRSREFQINVSVVHHFNSIERISSPFYLPTDQDILLCPAETRGVTETTFNVGELTYKLVDVSGHRGKRRKWIHYFENITAILLLVSLAEYDQVLYEDETVVCSLLLLQFFRPDDLS